MFFGISLVCERRIQIISLNALEKLWNLNPKIVEMQCATDSYKQIYSMDISDERACDKKFNINFSLLLMSPSFLLSFNSIFKTVLRIYLYK